MHTLVEVNPLKNQHYVPGSFFDWVDAMLPNKQKFQNFMNLLRVPFPTTSLTDEVFSSLEKVFDGRDPVMRRDFRNESLEDDYLTYWEEILGGGEKWRERAAQGMRTAFNSLIVVDLPEVQEGDRPEPYYYLLPSSRVVDFAETDGWMNLVAFWADDSKEILAVYDDEHYVTYSTSGKAGTIGSVISEKEHDLGECPVQHFWHTSLNGDGFQRQSPVSIQLGELDHLLKDVTFSRNHKLYAGYPVWTGFKQECSWQDLGSETYCYKGFMRQMGDNSGVVNQRTGGLLKCPKCAKGQEFAGPGTTILVDPPSGDNEMADLRNPAAMIEPGVGLLEWNRKDVEESARRIYMAITGNSQEAINDQAVNEKQITSLFEASSNVLMMLKVNLEISHNWIEMTIAKLRYGVDAVAQFVTNYGSQFYIFQADTILELYKAARNDKLDPTVLDTLQDQYYDTKYRHDSKMLERMNLLINLDPCRHLTTEEAKDLLTEGILHRVDYAVKANFASLLLRFERDNGTVTEFGSGLDFNKRVDQILESLRLYAEEGMSEEHRRVKEPVKGVPIGDPARDGENEEETDRQQPKSDKDDGKGGKKDKGQSAKARADAYGVAVRAGAITPQRSDEDQFRQELDLPGVSPEVAARWNEQGGVRSPLTIKTEEPGGESGV